MNRNALLVALILLLLGAAAVVSVLVTIGIVAVSVAPAVVEYLRHRRSVRLEPDEQGG